MGMHNNQCKQMGITLKDYNKNFLERWVKYDSTSDSGIVWVVPQYFNGTPNYKRIGKSAGHKVKNHGEYSYWNIRLEGVDYLVHRVVWVLVFGEIDSTSDIDHVDQNGFNNNISNLRLISGSVNCKNKPKRVDNTTGITGVSLQVSKEGHGCYRAQCNVNGRIKTKSFSTRKYGEVLALQLAVAARETLMMEDGHYTELHGK